MRARACEGGGGSDALGTKSKQQVKKQTKPNAETVRLHMPRFGFMPPIPSHRIASHRIASHPFHPIPSAPLRSLRSAPVPSLSVSPLRPTRLGSLCCVLRESRARLQLRQQRQRAEVAQLDRRRAQAAQRPRGVQRAPAAGPTVRMRGRGEQTLSRCGCGEGVSPISPGADVGEG